MAIINSFDTSKYTGTNGIADKVWGGLDALMGATGSIGTSVMNKRAANGKSNNERLMGYFKNMSGGSGGQFDLDNFLGGFFGGSGGSGGAGGTSIGTGSSSPSAGADIAGSASISVGGVAGADGGGATSTGGTGATGAAGGASGLPWGAIGDGIDKTWSIANNMIGDVYTKGRSKFDSDVINTAYGYSNDDPFFGNIGRNRSTNKLANDIIGEKFYSTANNASDLQKEIASSNLFHNEVEGPSKGQRVGAAFQAVGSGAAKGAKIGSKIGGPMGTLIGAGVGALGAGISKIFGKKRARRRLNKLNSAIRFNNMSKDQQVGDSVTNMTTMDNNRLMANAFAYGGVHDAIRRFDDAFSHSYADGGSMDGSEGKIGQSKQPTPNVTEFNAGGSHEENPHGGILQGIAPDGKPNLVEQGEVKLSSMTGDENQYILSARIVVTEEKARQFGIDPKLVGLSYAEAFKKAYNPLKERQGSHDARNEIAHIISIFQQAQDAEKAEREMAQQMAIIESMSPEQRSAMIDMATQAQQQQADMIAQQQQAMAQQQTGGMPQDAGIAQPSQEEMLAEQQAMEQQAMQEQAMQQQAMAQQGPPPEAMMAGGQPPYMAYGGQAKVLNKYNNTYAKGGKISTSKCHSHAIGGINSTIGGMFGKNSGALFGKKVGSIDDSSYDDYFMRSYDATDLLNAKELFDKYVGNNYYTEYPHRYGSKTTITDAPVTKHSEKPISKILQSYYDTDLSLPSYNNIDAKELYDKYAGNHSTDYSHILRNLTTLSDVPVTRNFKAPNVEVTQSAGGNVVDMPIEQKQLTGEDAKQATGDEDRQVAGRKPTDAEEAKAQHDKIMNEIGFDSLRRKASLDKVPVWAGIYTWLKSKDYLQDADRYNRITREGLSRSMISPESLGGYYTPRYIDPEYQNASLKSQTAQALRNAATLAGGNRSAAQASQALLFKNAMEARGNQLYNAQVANEQIRANARQMNNAIDAQNAQNRLSADAQNAARIASAYDKIEQTEASVDQYNKAMKLQLLQNAANLMGKYGVDNRNRLLTAVMAANGVYGKGANSIFQDIQQ